MYLYIDTVWKVSKYGVFSDPYIPAFGLNTERYFISLRIQSEFGKIRTRKNSVFGHFSRSEIFYKSFVQQVMCLRVDSCTYLRADFLEQVHVFFSHHYVCWTSRNFREIFPESPVLVDQATRHLQNSNPNLLEHLSRRLDDCLNVVNVFLSRYEELNIPETLTTNIRRFVEELCSIHTHILNVIINKHDFVLNSNHPCFFLSAKPIYTELGRP